MSYPSDGRRTDADLLAAHVAGDPHAFGDLFERHRDRLWAVALRAQPAGQRTPPTHCRTPWCRPSVEPVRSVARRPSRPGCIASWSMPALDQHRRQNKPTTSWIENLHEVAHDVDDMANRELQIELERALSQLPSDQRAAIVLVDVEGYAVDDAAAILGCPPGTVKSRCSRGTRETG